MQAVARGICRLLLRFLLFYWICFTFPFPLDLIGLPFQLVEAASQPEWMKTARGYYGTAFGWVYEAESGACKWVGETVLGVEVVLQPTGSGDTMRSYVGCLCAAAVAVIAALLWTIFALLMRRLKPGWDLDAFLHRTVRLLVRFFLFEMLLGYGLAKLFPLQFAEPSSFRLAQQLGDMSPMGLLWTFMGFSTPYQMFTGAIEVIGGLLLTTRRTTLLGALVTVVAMTQIFLLNMCFDVPVKLYSFHYLLMALFLIAPDLPRLTKLLVLGRSVEAAACTPFLGNLRIDRCAVVFRTVLIAGVLYAQVHANYRRWYDTYGGPPLPVTGRWEVISMQIDKKGVDKTDPAAWNWIDFSNKSYLRLAGPKPPNAVYKMSWDTEEKKLTLGKFTAPTWSAQFTYHLLEPDKFVLQGSMDAKEISATLKPAPEKHYELMNRGFHWIQELPYNR